MIIQGRQATPEEVEEIERSRAGRPGGTEAVDWSPVADGAWRLVHEGGTSADYRRAFERIKRGSKRWAERKGMERNLRSSKADRKIWIRFYAPTDEETR